MAKTTTTTQVTEKAQDKLLPLKLLVKMDSFTDRDGKQNSYVAADLIEPFEKYKDDFNNVRIAPRWDRDASLFKFRMRIALRSSDNIILSGYCEPVGYPSKKLEDNGKIIYYPGIFFKVPYSGEVIEFGFKKRKETDKDGHSTYSESSDCYIFRDLIFEHWGGSYEPAAGGSAFGDSLEGESVPEGTSLRSVY